MLYRITRPITNPSVNAALRDGYNVNAETPEGAVLRFIEENPKFSDERLDVELGAGLPYYYVGRFSTQPDGHVIRIDTDV